MTPSDPSDDPSPIHGPALFRRALPTLQTQLLPSSFAEFKSKSCADVLVRRINANMQALALSSLRGAK